MLIARLFLALNALAIGVIAAVYLFDPNILLGRYGLETGSAGMDNMLRATYGGLYLVCAGIFAVGIVSLRLRRASLAFLGLFMAGNAIGRIASIMLAGSPPEAILPLLWYEIGTAIIALVLVTRVPRP